MLATRPLPPEYRDFNRRFGAPFGRSSTLINLAKRASWSTYLRLAGPFAIQENNTIREFEYPWAYFQSPMLKGLNVVEIGGGLGGFQFALDRMGARVLNVDPGMEANGVGWPCDPNTMARLNKLYGTGVELRNTIMKNAKLPDSTFDCVYSISVIEHLPDDDIKDAVSGAYRCLKQGGLFILTVDLFLNLAPFTARQANKFGRNVDVKWLAGLAPFILLRGNTSELFGYEQFVPDAIQSNLEKYYIGSYPAMSQCFVLQKPDK